MIEWIVVPSAGAEATPILALTLKARPHFICSSAPMSERSMVLEAAKAASGPVSGMITTNFNGQQQNICADANA